MILLFCSSLLFLHSLQMQTSQAAKSNDELEISILPSSSFHFRLPVTTMKLSIKLEDDQNSVVRAKLPITIYNRPFMSTLTAATATTANNIFSVKSSSNPSFSLSTNFHYGPSLRVSYTPSPSSTTSSPFSVSLKSGLGHFGSPKNSPLIFSAHFSLSPTPPATLVPTFSLHFKPQFGNFSLHQASFSNPNFCEPVSGFISGSADGLHHGSSSDSGAENGFASNGSSGWQEVKLEASNCNGDASANPSIACVPDRSSVHKNGNRSGVFSGIGFNARTFLPLAKRLAVNMRWNVRFPTDSWMKMPYLTMNKIGIERLEQVEQVNDKNKNVESNAGDVELLTDLCFRLRGDLKVLDKENREMKRLVEEMKHNRASHRNLHSESEGSNRKKASASPAKVENPAESEKWRGRRSVGEDSGSTGEMKRNQEKASDVESELQRAIKAASAQ